MVQPDTIADRIAAVRERISVACRRAGRRSEEVTLIGVSKTFPLQFVEEAADAGLSDFGENRVQEFVEKARVALPRRLGGRLTWHMIGHLQRNKAKDVIEYADVFHALDSRRLAAELHKKADTVERRLPCFVQVNVSGEASKFGIEPDMLPAFLLDLAPYDRLDVVGLMTIAAPTENPETIRPQFARLRRLLETERDNVPPHINLSGLSMGMSGDFEVAIEEGATHVRIGSVIFGQRDQP
ncbi:MAG: YggS family pyridoxal phosphate-dependent enzyme [Bacteroidota bacterium]